MNGRTIVAGLVIFIIGILLLKLGSLLAEDEPVDERPRIIDKVQGDTPIKDAVEDIKQYIITVVTFIFTGAMLCINGFSFIIFGLLQRSDRKKMKILLKMMEKERKKKEKKEEHNN